MLRNRTALGLVAPLVAFVCLLLSTQARADIYVATTDYGNGGAVYQYSNNGASIASPLLSGLSNPNGFAVVGSDLYVEMYNTSKIAQYSTSGTLINPNFITNLSAPQGVAVSGGNFFVTNWGDGSIREFSSSGAYVSTIVSGLYEPLGIAASGGNLYVVNGQPGVNSRVSEYTTTGTLVTDNLVSAVNNFWGLTISGSDMFVSDYRANTVGEFTLTGQTVNASLVTGLNWPVGVSVAGGNLYVVNQEGGSIGEYTTSGAVVNANLVTGLPNPYDIIVTPEPGSLLVLGLGIAGLAARRRAPKR